MGHYAADMHPEWFQKPKVQKQASGAVIANRAAAPTAAIKAHLAVLDDVEQSPNRTVPNISYRIAPPVTVDCTSGELRQIVDLAEEIEKIEAAVDNFADRVKSRLIQKAKQGFSGWETAHPDVMRSLLLDSVTKTSTLDLGIYAMMLAHRGISMKQGDSSEV